MGPVPGIEGTMGTRVRCPHCEEVFFAAASAAQVHCPACAEVLPTPKAAPAPGRTASPQARTGPTAASAPGVPRLRPRGGSAESAAKAAGVAGNIDLHKTCPACGFQYPGEAKRCPECGAGFASAKMAKTAETEGSFQHEKAGLRKGVLGGIIMIVIAAVWFFGGLAAGYIFYYPPILAVVGIFGVIKGLAEGNMAGKKDPPRTRRR